MGWLPAVRTPLSREAAARTIAEVTGLRGAALALALAQSGLETSQWSEIYNYNFGNLRPTAGQDYVTLRTNEREGGKIVWYGPGGKLAGKDGPVIAEAHSVPPGHPKSRFRAFQNARAGADGWWKLLHNKRYSAALAALLAGDAKAFGLAAGAAGYFTADPQIYAPSLVALQRQFMPLAASIAPAPQAEQTAKPRPRQRGGAGWLVLALGAVAIAVGRRHARRK